MPFCFPSRRWCCPLSLELGKTSHSGLFPDNNSAFSTGVTSLCLKQDIDPLFFNGPGSGNPWTVTSFWAPELHETEPRYDDTRSLWSFNWQLLLHRLTSREKSYFHQLSTEPRDFQLIFTCRVQKEFQARYIISYITRKKINNYNNACGISFHLCHNKCFPWQRCYTCRDVTRRGVAYRSAQLRFFLPTETMQI